MPRPYLDVTTMPESRCFCPKKKSKIGAMAARAMQIVRRRVG